MEDIVSSICWCAFFLGVVFGIVECTDNIKARANEEKRIELEKQKVDLEILKQRKVDTIVFRLGSKDAPLY